MEAGAGACLHLHVHPRTCCHLSQQETRAEKVSSAGFTSCGANRLHPAEGPEVPELRLNERVTKGRGAYLPAWRTLQCARKAGSRDPVLGSFSATSCGRRRAAGGISGPADPPGTDFRGWGRARPTSGRAGADGTTDFRARGSGRRGPPFSRAGAGPVAGPERGRCGGRIPAGGGRVVQGPRPRPEGVWGDRL